jgi:hypothetical protein
MKMREGGREGEREGHQQPAGIRACESGAALLADGTVVWGLERGTLRKNPKLDTKHQGKQLYCLEVPWV